VRNRVSFAAMVIIITVCAVGFAILTAV